jgi:dTDP-4-dehydrorhamnose 3,5-epimerase
MGAITDLILVTPLKRIAVAGGDVMHAMKLSDAGSTVLGEAYFSWVNPGMVKAWKRHLRMTMNLLVPHGCVRFVFWDGCTENFREETICAESRYVRLTVPAGVWFGFQGRSVTSSLVLNLASIEHNPLEVERMDQTAVNYDWNLI